jgi:hypothetical protein
VFAWCQAPSPIETFSLADECRWDVSPDQSVVKFCIEKARGLIDGGR